MVNFIHECVGCTYRGLHCLGNSCSRGHYEHICDWCDREVDTLYEYEGEDVCKECLLESLEMKEEEGYDTSYLVNGEWMIESDALFEFKKYDY